MNSVHVFYSILVCKHNSKVPAFKVIGPCKASVLLCCSTNMFHTLL